MGIRIYVRAFLILGLFRYFIGVKFYKNMRHDCTLYSLRKIKMQDIRPEYHTRFSGRNYNVPFYSKLKCH